MTIIAAQKIGNNYSEIKRDKNNFFIASIIALILAVWLGLRPISPLFGDTTSYAHKFYLMQNDIIESSRSYEVIWLGLMDFCAKRFDVSTFLLIVSIGYFGFTLLACKRFAPNNPLIALLFVMGAFSFFSYGTNGIRNGLACSIVLVAISLLNEKKQNIIIAILLSIIAYNIHKSTILPIITAFISFFAIRTFKWGWIFWLFSIVISLVAGTVITEFFTSLGFDDRLEQYTSEIADEETFSYTGFRWDFLLYSAMPILLGYYIVIQKKVQNKMYILLLNTYTLSNSFWIMVIRANYSNRFAYLSWFMYPIVLAYPLLELDVWGDKQGLMLRRIMFAQIGFTWFMETFYWS